MKGKVVCLISGGIDSPVASYLVMNKGFTPVFVYCDNSPYGDEAALVRTVNSVSKLEQNHDGETELLVVPHGESLTQAMKCSRKYLCILCKRSMFRIAEAIADLEEAEAIVTGGFRSKGQSNPDKPPRYRGSCETSPCKTSHRNEQA